MSDHPLPQLSRATLQGPPATRSHTILFACGLILLTFLAYLPALSAGFIWDDDVYVYQNHALETADGLWRIWTHLGTVPQYYPVTHTTFFLEHALWGFSPAGYHVINILLHAASALVLWRLLRKLAVPGASAIALVFAIHPVHVESVAWVTERKNVLSGLLYLLALSVYWPMVDNPEADRNRQFNSPRYYAALTLFILALLSKSVASSLPAAILLLIWWKRGRLTWRDALPLLPFFILGAAMGYVTAHMERTVVGASGPDWNFSFPNRILIAGQAIWFYLLKLLIPSNLCFVYPRFDINPHHLQLWLAPAAILLILIALWALRHRLGRGPLVAALFFCGTLFPALGFVNVYPMLFSFVADHFQYMASIGIITLIVASLARLPQIPRTARISATALVVLLLAILSFRQARIYNNLNTLWTDTLQKNPNAWIASNNLANLLLDHISELPPDQQRANATQALKLSEHSWSIHHGMPTLGNMATACSILGQDDRAQALLQQIIDSPEFTGSREWSRYASNAHTSIADHLLKTGDTPAAEEHYRKAFELRPGTTKALFQLVSLATARKDFGPALALLQQAVDVEPNSPSLWTNVGNIHFQTNRPDLAIKAYSRALECDPSHRPARYGLAISLAATGRLIDAESILRSLLADNPQSPEVLSSLNKVLAMQNRVPLPSPLLGEGQGEGRPTEPKPAPLPR